ncbi:MAG TPA: hypothetical protein VFN99_11365 [Gaiella sp.]|nr:hypothetical protein [Gaiella sp.]
MDVAATLTSRLIGTLFVERGLVSESQVRVALEIQRETGEQLGKILVDRFGVSRKELASIVAEQWAELGQSGSPEADARSNESWRRLGEIFVERGFVTQEQLDEALRRQRETGERVGEALVAQGAISKFELAGALAEQMSVLGEEDAAAGTEAVTGTVVALVPREEPEPAPEPAAPLDVEPEVESAFGCVAFASTPAGYRLVQLGGPAPDVGTPLDVPDVGELVVIRLGRSPLPGDQRTCVFLEQAAPTFGEPVAAAG